jgi:DNA-binding MarR family transcriptional regulator
MSDQDVIEPKARQRTEGQAADLNFILSMPGYLIRRSKQTATSIFAEICKNSGITPIQFATLFILKACPLIDQTELGDYAGLDSSTTGDVIQRLARRGLLSRSEDGNRRICDLTAQGLELVNEMTPRVLDAQKQVMSRLTAREQGQLLRLLSKMNNVTNQYYTAPLGRRRRRAQTKRP